MVECPSPVAANHPVQAAMAKPEADLPPDQRLTCRIGVNLGDVIAEGDDVIGDGVNIAARLAGVPRDRPQWGDDLPLRGHQQFVLTAPQANARAIQIWEQGLAKYPGSGLPKVELAWGHYIALRFRDRRNMRSVDENLAKAQVGMAAPTCRPPDIAMGIC